MIISVNFPCHFLNFFLCLLVRPHKEPQRKRVGIPPREKEHSKEVVKSLMWVSSSGSLSSGQLSGFFFHTWPILEPSPEVCTHRSAKMDLKVKASGRSKTHYGLELSLNFWLQGACVQFSSVQSLSCVRHFATPWTATHQASLSITNSWNLLKLMSVESVMSSNHLTLCHPLLLLPSIFASIRVFSDKSVPCVRWSKYWSFSFSISPSNEYSGLISFRMDWLDVLAVQGILKSLLQHHSSKASILQCSAFFIVQLSHPYMTTGKTIALTRWTFVGKVLSLFNKLSRLVIGFLPRSKHLLISWLQSPSSAILEPRKIKSATVSTVSPFICHEAMGPDAIILVFWMLSFKLTFSFSSFTFIKRL